jgi:chromosome segregation ATPase
LAENQKKTKQLNDLQNAYAEAQANILSYERELSKIVQLENKLGFLETENFRINSEYQELRDRFANMHSELSQKD